MIRLVSGDVIGTGKSFLIIEVGGVGSGLGVRVYVPESTRNRFRLNTTVALHTFLQVRETELSLYGFETAEELEIFEHLLAVSGVGPKVAMATLSTLSPDTLRLAIANKEPAVLAQAPGVGQRTAEKILLELKGKLAPTDDSLADLTDTADTVDTDSEVVEALTSLGYSVIEAQRAVQKLPADTGGVEERLRLALSTFDGR